VTREFWQPTGAGLNLTEREQTMSDLVGHYDDGGESVASSAQSAGELTDHDEMAILGYLSAIFLPIAGFCIGIQLMTKYNSGHGPVCMFSSIVFGLIWLAIIGSTLWSPPPA
jgi:hypothetical protein